MKCGDPANPAGPFIKANGKPCGNDCAPGFTRCGMHGAKSPASKLAAERALVFARLPACESLYTIIERWQADTCGACGFPTGDHREERNMLVAAKMILDRTGLPATTKVEVASQSDGAPIVVEHLTETERGEFAAIIAQFKEFKTRVRARLIAVPGLAAMSTDTAVM